MRDEVKFWLPIIIAIVSVTTSFAVLKSEVAHLRQEHDYEIAVIAEDIKEGKAECADIRAKWDPTLLEIQESLAVVQNDLLWLRMGLEELNQKVEPTRSGP